MTTSDNSKTVPALGPNASDRITALIRSLVSAVPIAGTALAEVITEIIPNQRIERIEQYLKLLAEEIEAMNMRDAAERVRRPENVDLIEEGAQQATRAVSEERRRYLAHAVAQGIASDEIDRMNESRILKLIEELDDRDILILDAYQAHGNLGREKFERLRPDHPTINSPTRVVEMYGLYEAALGRLERLSLIEKRIRLNQEGIPDFDRFTGQPQGTTSITPLGRLILRRIGLKQGDAANSAGKAGPRSNASAASN